MQQAQENDSFTSLFTKYDIVKIHHRFPAFENPFPLRAKTKVLRTSKLCHQQSPFKLLNDKVIGN